MHILLVNDDGIYAPGLRAIHAALSKFDHQISVVAPATEQSAVGHAVTLSMPLKISHVEEENFTGIAVHGTPVDCVKLAITTLLSTPPDLVVSGINAGANVGVDIIYSGTVSAATEGALMNLPAIAVSVDNYDPKNLQGQAEYAAKLIDKFNWEILPKRRMLNLNFPPRPIEETLPLTICPHTDVSWQDWYEVRTDPRGKTYYWLNGVIPAEKIKEGRDRRLLTEGHITLTPLRFDFTDHEMFDALEKELL